MWNIEKDRFSVSIKLSKSIAKKLDLPPEWLAKLALQDQINKEGLIERAECIIPTAQNLRSIEDDLRALAPALVAVGPASPARSRLAGDQPGGDVCAHG